MKIVPHPADWQPPTGTLVAVQSSAREPVHVPGVPADQLDRVRRIEGFEGRHGQLCRLVGPAGSPLERVVLAGVDADAPVRDLHGLGATLAREDWLAASGRLTIRFDGLAHAAAHEILTGLLLRYYRFDTYRTDRQPLPGLEVDVVGASPALADALTHLPVEIEAVHLVRDLVNEPGNVLTPEAFAHRIVALATPVGLSVEVLDPARLAELGANLLLGVGQGSANPPRMVIIRMAGDGAPTALVGKGLTFDTGGVHIKPVTGLWEMKNDMAGAATIAATMIALARAGVRRPLVAVLGLAENMTSGSAIRPGDILRSLADRMVEVRNTDCEGRLVLADCLAYAQQAFSPRYLIDVATLTYAVQVGLGPRYAGIYGNDEALADALLEAARAAGELVWPMPIDAEFHDELASDFADFLNWPGVPYGNASIAAAFLEKFVGKDMPWAHIDIAGPAYAPRGSLTSPAGGTGFGVRTLLRHLRG